MADVFLSYSSKDEPAARRVQQALTARGIDVFWDQATPVGQDWDSWIRAKLGAAKVAVVLWSKSSIQSPNVRHEAMVARDSGKLVPAMIEPLQAADFPMGLYLVQAIHLNDWINSSSTGMARLVAEVEARLAIKGVSLPPPPPPPANPASWVAGAFVLAAVAGAAWWFTREAPDALPAGPVETATVAEVVVCAGAAPPVFGVCPSDMPPTADTADGPAATESFASRMQGHWRWTDETPCSDGSFISLESPGLVFSTPDSRFAHAVESESGLEVRTRVIEPASDQGDQYVFTPEFFAASEVRSFNLVVQNLTKGSRDVWTPCEVN